MMAAAVQVRCRLTEQQLLCRTQAATVPDGCQLLAGCKQEPPAPSACASAAAVAVMRQLSAPHLANACWDCCG